MYWNRANMRLIKPTHTLYLVKFKNKIYWGRYEQRGNVIMTFWRSRPLLKYNSIRMTYTEDLLRQKSDDFVWWYDKSTRIFSLVYVGQGFKVYHLAKGNKTDVTKHWNYGYFNNRIGKYDIF